MEEEQSFYMGQSSTAKIVGKCNVDSKFESSKILDLNYVFRVHKIPNNVVFGDLLMRTASSWPLKLNPTFPC